VISVTNRRRALGAALTLLLALVVAPFVWRALYPDADDPKNIDYVLWKNGMNRNINLDIALRAMAHDSPGRKVVGLSREELERKFGYVRTLGSRSRLGSCYSWEVIRNPQASEVVSLRDSFLIVALENGKAIELIDCKGG
jgi:hypothetical protein